MSNFDVSGLGDLNHLTALDALLETRSVTVAAQRLGVTQSAMSHRLKRLRELLDDELLVRGPQGMVPTARAELIRDPLREALKSVAAAVSQGASFDPATSDRRFVVAGSDYGEFTALPRVLKAIFAESPNTSIDLRPPGPRLLAELARGDVDVYIGPMFRAPKAESLVRKRVQREGFVLVARAGHPALDGGAVDLETYIALRHLQIAPTGRPGGLIDDYLAELGLSRHVAVRTAYFVTAPFMVAQTDLIWTAPRGLAEVARDYVPIQLFDLPFESPTIDSFMFWHRRASADPGHQWLRARIEESLQR